VLTRQEVHIIHPFAHDFYGHDMSVLVLGYIRPELDYVSKGESRCLLSSCHLSCCFDLSINVRLSPLSFDVLPP